MKRVFLLLAFCLISVFGFSQTYFQKGYFIDNNDKKIECFIKNKDWRNNPKSFDYKLDSLGIEKTENIGNIKEFSVINFSKYIRTKVLIDRSPVEINNLDYERNSQWSQEMLFLKVLLEGKANLYVYEDNLLFRKFFFSVDNKKIKQLIHKRYFDQNSVTIINNNSFKNQLKLYVSFGNQKDSEFLRIKYKPKSLKNYFTKYNNHNGIESIIPKKESKEKKDMFDLNISLGAFQSSFFYDNNFTNLWDIKFEDRICYSFGIETEFFLPFNNKKWSIIFEPTYQYYKSEGENERGKAEIDYSSIELAMGGKHYCYLNKKSRLFLEANVLYNVVLNNEIKFEYTGKKYRIDKNYTFSLGIGYQYKRYTAKIKYFRPYALINIPNSDNEYKKSAFIFAYSLF